MNPLERRLDVLEAALSREGQALREKGAPAIVAAELVEVGCSAVVSDNGVVVVVDESLDASPEIAERRDSRLGSLAARSQPLADVLVVVLRRLAPFPEQSDTFSMVVVAEGAGQAEVFTDAEEVARGTVEELAHGSIPRALTTRSTEEET